MLELTLNGACFVLAEHRLLYGKMEPYVLGQPKPAKATSLWAEPRSKAARASALDLPHAGVLGVAVHLAWHDRYETDVRLPMYVRGPGVPKGEVRAHPTNHVDLTKTLAELAGGVDAHAKHPLDGKSFADVLHGASDVDAWRNFSFSEFFEGRNTWHKLRWVNGTTGEAGWRCTGPMCGGMMINPLADAICTNETCGLSAPCICSRR